MLGILLEEKAGLKIQYIGYAYNILEKCRVILFCSVYGVRLMHNRTIGKEYIEIINNYITKRYLGC